MSYESQATWLIIPKVVSERDAVVEKEEEEPDVSFVSSHLLQLVQKPENFEIPDYDDNVVVYQIHGIRNSLFTF
jgi:hypothetical protein